MGGRSSSSGGGRGAARQVVSVARTKQQQRQQQKAAEEHAAAQLNPAKAKPLTLNERFSLIAQQRRNEEAKSRQESSRAQVVEARRMGRQVIAVSVAPGKKLAVRSLTMPLACLYHTLDDPTPTPLHPLQNKTPC